MSSWQKKHHLCKLQVMSSANASDDVFWQGEKALGAAAKVVGAMGKEVLER